MTQSNTSWNKRSSDIPINRGVELILGEKKKVEKPQSLIRFGRMFSLPNREIHICFEISVNNKK